MGHLKRYAASFAPAAIITLAIALALAAAIGDSITFDETLHLTAGYSYLKTRDFRFALCPPAADVLAALPILAVPNTWPGEGEPSWRAGDYWEYGRRWLCELNAGERLMLFGRLVTIAELACILWIIHKTAQRFFGRGGALLSLTLAVFCPTLLAHGHLVTADVPVTLAALLTLIAFARLANHATIPRAIGASAALGLASVTKMSWPLLVPALALMAVVAVLRRTPWRASALSHSANSAFLANRGGRLGLAALIGVSSALGAWATIWTAYGWRYSPFRGAGATMMTGDRPSADSSGDMAQTWRHLLDNADGRSRPGTTPALVRLLRAGRWLPEAYLFALATADKTIRPCDNYFMGEYSRQGWLAYFPVAVAIKTPLASVILVLAGLAALLARRASLRADPVLATGLIGFAVLYLATAVFGNLNIGVRHLLPVYPIGFVLAGAGAAAWPAVRAVRWAGAALLGWLVIAVLLNHPHHLAYFNELIGGPRNGHLYLADSNIDWGQDLKRFARYAREHPEQRFLMCYFGSVNPFRYFEDSGAERVTAVVSVTNLLGVYRTEFRPEYWADEGNLREFRELERRVRRAEAAGGVESSPPELAEAQRRDRELLAGQRMARLVARLRGRQPDDRVGWSLMLFHLTPADVALLRE